MNCRTPCRCSTACPVCPSGSWATAATPATPFGSISGTWARGPRSRPSATKRRWPAPTTSTATGTSSKVVLTQMTKPHALAVGVERDGVADLDLAVGDEHSVDQQLHELALLREVRAGQTGPNPLTE